MDYIRSCYQTDMVLSPGGPAVPVRWYFTDPGAEVFVGPTPFRSRYRDSAATDPDDLGEVAGALRPWRNGENFRSYPGTKHCADLGELEHGADELPAATFDPDCCCKFIKGTVCQDADMPCRIDLDMGTASSVSVFDFGNVTLSKDGDNAAWYGFGDTSPWRLWVSFLCLGDVFKVWLDRVPIGDPRPTIHFPTSDWMEVIPDVEEPYSSLFFINSFGDAALDAGGAAEGLTCFLTALPPY